MISKENLLESKESVLYKNKDKEIKMTFILIGAILIFVISITWIWHNLGNIEKPRKVIFIVIGLLIMYAFTVVLYHSSSSNIAYPSEEIQKTVSDTLILIFTGLNTLIFLPFIANLMDKILEEEVEKQQSKKRIIILLVIFVICVFVEKGYLENTQKGIINIYNEVQNAEK